LQELIKGKDIVTYTNAQRLKWWGHLTKMTDIKLVKKITDWDLIGVRTNGWPKNRWRDEVMIDLKKLKLRNWSQLIKDRKAWNDLVQRIKTHVRL
jgi:hypothetical protein